jgi:hypothetical protein
MTVIIREYDRETSRAIDWQERSGDLFTAFSSGAILAVCPARPGFSDLAQLIKMFTFRLKYVLH